jgi:hypothetical protein
MCPGLRLILIVVFENVLVLLLVLVKSLEYILTAVVLVYLLRLFSLRGECNNITHTIHLYVGPLVSRHDCTYKIYLSGRVPLRHFGSARMSTVEVLLI